MSHDALSVNPSVVELCSHLISLDSSNYGPGGRAGERSVADYVVAILSSVGYDPVILESAPGRANVLLRVPGKEKVPIRHIQFREPKCATDDPVVTNVSSRAELTPRAI